MSASETECDVSLSLRYVEANALLLLLNEHTTPFPNNRQQALRLNVLGKLLNAMSKATNNYERVPAECP